LTSNLSMTVVKAAPTVISGERMKELDERALDRHAFDGEWNYTVRTAPAPTAAGPVGAL
jgi:hypothetical protein